ncbi:MAG: hypothetical protein IT439_00510 [Phycisphaerales bacterium]|nr:hypothetical protein [Phycisphaerales bacterium]
MPPRKTEDPFAEARRQYRRVLASWSQDLLRLRRLGWDRPCFRSEADVAEAGPVRPPAPRTRAAA